MTQPGDGGDEGFFYPEQTDGPRRGRPGVRPPGHNPRAGSRLAWFLNAFLLAVMAALLVWVDAPLRAQLHQVTQAQEQAMAAVAQLEAHNVAATLAPGQNTEAGATAPGTPADDAPGAADGERAWAQQQCRMLAAALQPQGSVSWVDVAVRDGQVVLRLALEATFAEAGKAPGPLQGEPAARWDALAAALGQSLAADESPYQLHLFVPQREAQTAVAASPEPSRGRHGRRSRRQKRREEGAASMTAVQLAGARAAVLLERMEGKLALRPKSQLLASFGPPALAEDDGGVQLRLLRQPG